jgi:hypothetical protein
MLRIACRSLAGFAVSAFLSVSAHAQQPDKLLDDLAGNWILDGTVADQQATFDAAAEWVMDHQYLRIHLVSREMQPNGKTAYEATAFIGWDAAAKQYACVWLDNRGLSPASFANAKPSGD